MISEGTGSDPTAILLSENCTHLKKILGHLSIILVMFVRDRKSCFFTQGKIQVAVHRVNSNLLAAAATHFYLCTSLLALAQG